MAGQLLLMITDAAQDIVRPDGPMWAIMWSADSAALGADATAEQIATKVAAFVELPRQQLLDMAESLEEAS